jgi:hypothetical protein
MEFKISGKYNETYIKECLAMWKFSSKDVFRSVRIFSACSLVYLIIGLVNYLREKPISLFVSTLGLACFILLIIQLIGIYQSKATLKKNLLASIDKFKSDTTASRELIFFEDYIKYCNPEMMLELKWAAISHYQESGDYTLFFLNESKKPSLSMDKNNIPESIKKDLFELINSKISRRD